MSKFALSWTAWLKLNKRIVQSVVCTQKTHEVQALTLHPADPPLKQTPCVFVLLLSLCWYVHWVIISQPENSACCQRPWRVYHSWQQGGTRWAVAQVNHIPGPCLSVSVSPFIYCCLPACPHSGSSLWRNKGCLAIQPKRQTGDRRGRKT